MVREVNARVLGRGLKLADGNDNEWELNQLLFADDTVVVADSERKLCQLVTKFGRVCERRKLRVNVGKSKVMRCTIEMYRISASASVSADHPHCF